MSRIRLAGHAASFIVRSIRRRPLGSCPVGGPPETEDDVLEVVVIDVLGREGSLLGKEVLLALLGVEELMMDKNNDKIMGGKRHIGRHLIR